MDLKEEELLGDAVYDHWYYVSKADALRKVILPMKSTSILDIGAGSGFFSRNLIENTETIESFCVDLNYPESRTESFGNKNIYFEKSIESANVDLVLMMDVLEHVENDIELIREYIKKTPAKTKFIITVPAFDFLWSRHDEYLGHCRRYNISQINSVIKASGLRLDYSFYYFGVIFPVAAIIRLLGKLQRSNANAKSDLKVHNKITNGMIKVLCKMETITMRANKLAGLTIFCVASKS